MSHYAILAFGFILGALIAFLGIEIVVLFREHRRNRGKKDFEAARKAFREGSGDGK
ncbi:MAG: hypothetical protein WC593_15665 [Methanoregula sp.]